IAGAPAGNLTDGSFSTNAVTDNSQSSPNAEWYQIDLGADYFIDSIRLGAADVRSSRRFMLATWPSAVGTSLGNVPADYIGVTFSVSLYNRYIYTDTAHTRTNPFGTYAGNPNVPGIAGLSFGQAFPSGVLSAHIGTHKARYVLILSLQDTSFALSEIQVFTTTQPKVRSFSNGSFETGPTHTSSVANLHEASLPAWSTTEAVALSSGIAMEPEKGSFIEIWRSGAFGVTSASGNYHAELNAFTAGMLEQQPICVQGGETFTWSFAHRGRSGVDTMNLHINDVDVASFSDNNASSGTHTGSLLAGGLATTVISSSVTHATNGWTQWTGTWTNPSTAARAITFGFRAVGSAGGGRGIGNFIDSVSVTTSAAYATFSSDTRSGGEDIPSANLPRIIINGQLSTAHTIEVDITGGTAVRGTDYTTTPASGIITANIPAGNYDGTYATGISLAPYISIIHDALPEPNETLVMRLQNPSPATLQIVSDTACMPAITEATYTLLDAVPLPVDLVSFDVDVIKDCKLRFTWVCGVESRLSHYQLECSRDGQNFLFAAEQKNASGSNTHYEQTISSPEEGISMYRLKMIDLSGKARYSEVLRLNRHCDAQDQIVLYPNPSDGIVRVKGLAQEAEIRVTDAFGKELMRATLHTGQDNLNISNLQPGLYMMSVQTANTLHQYRINRR
ncbi:MAG: T9SS type A sorting domain-containing protein, partial [Chitinophagaceae bacterium]|nr:T9SS type A sorting domain-containing protein [Chitinophagaceae bacterium]